MSSDQKSSVENNKEIKIENKKKFSPPLLIIGILVMICGLGVGILGGWLLSRSNTKTQTLSSIKAAPQVSANEQSFKIGMILPLTGDAASYGTNAKEISQMFEKQINNSGGIGGRKLQIFYEDGQCTEEPAKVAAEKLINETKVDLLYGGECSDEFLAAAPIAQAKKIITITTSASSPKISTLGKYIFRSWPSDNLGGKAAAQYAKKKMSAKTAAVLTENTSYAHGLAEVFKTEFEKNGNKIVLEKTYETGETDFTEFANSIKKLEPDLVYFLPQSPIPGVLTVKALKEAKVSSKLFTAEVMLARDEVAKHGKILEGAVGMEAYFDDSLPQYKELQKQFLDEYGREVAYPTDLVQIYDMFQLYKEAYEKVGSNDTDKISEYFYQVKDWNGASGKVTFDQNGDIISRPYGIFKITNNAVSLLETYTAQLE